MTEKEIKHRIGKFLPKVVRLRDTLQRPEDSVLIQFIEVFLEAGARFWATVDRQSPATIEKLREQLAELKYWTDLVGILRDEKTIEVQKIIWEAEHIQFLIECYLGDRELGERKPEGPEREVREERESVAEQSSPTRKPAQTPEDATYTEEEEQLPAAIETSRDEGPPAEASWEETPPAETPPVEMFPVETPGDQTPPVEPPREETTEEEEPAREATTAETPIPQERAREEAQESEKEPAPEPVFPPPSLEGSTQNILIVTSKYDDVDKVRWMLAQSIFSSYQLVACETLAEALNQLEHQKFTAVLLELSLPDSSGLETIIQLREKDSKVPVILIGGADEKNLQTKALQYDAQDFVFREEWNAALLQRAIRYGISIKAAEHHATSDNLTGLANRSLMEQQLRTAVAQAKRSSGTQLIAVLFLDLDYFKRINDSYGHAAGDKALKLVAGRLQENVRESDSVARHGGDEFVVLLTQLTDEFGATRVAQKILTSVSRPIQIDSQEVFITASIGISIFPNDGSDPQTLVQNADSAMYRAKEAGRNQFQFFQPEINIEVTRQETLKEDLAQGLEDRQFFLLYQPLIEIKSGELVSVEALLRWQHPRFGLLRPEHFLAFAESGSFINTVDRWVARNACSQLVQWYKPGLARFPIRLNISRNHLNWSGFLNYLKDLLPMVGLEPKNVVLEIPESSLKMESLPVESFFKEASKFGVRISLDDFGTARSSIASLKKFQVSTLKIDRSIIQQLESDPIAKAIIKATISMAHDLGVKTIAEGVEKDSELEFLKAAGCDYLQGYYSGRPMPGPAFENFLQEARPEGIIPDYR